MDILSHTLWAGVIARFINFKKKKPMSVWLTAFWGVLPDFFAFTPMFVWLGFQFLFGDFDFSKLSGPEHMEPSQPDTLFIFRLTNFLYSVSHSLSVFILVFAIMWLIFRRPRYSVFGWLIHILIDIPTHNYKFYPTPFLWPFSDWKFDGFSWADPWFLFFNYLAILLAWLLIKWKSKIDKK